MSKDWQSRARATATRLRTQLSAFSLRKHWSLFFIVLGALLLIYVGSEYASTYLEQKRLAREWAEQQEQAGKNGASKSQQAAVVDDGLTRISIPKINLNAIVVDGTSYKKLKLGPGRMTDTAVPGTVGNSVITAHRDTFFRHIYELNKGDEIVVQRNGREFRYQVTGKKIVDPSDLSVTRQSKDKRLTLITCYPTYYIGPAPERLVVFSKLAEEPPEKAMPNPVAAANGGAN